jgi:hypothetical protein
MAGVSGSLVARIARLEDRLRPGGCRICRRWGPTRVVSLDAATGGEVAAFPPDRCPARGRHMVYAGQRVYVGLDLAAV